METPFGREREAYAHLLHYGACAAGVVPSCFGWLESLPSTLVDRTTALLSSPSNSVGIDVPSTSTRGWVPTKALLFEYIPLAKRISADTIYLDVAHQLIQALVTINTSYVHRESIRARDMLVVRGSSENDSCRVLWTNFTNATCASNPSVKKQDFYREFRGCWEYLFRILVSP